MIQNAVGKVESTTDDVLPTRRARVILDISGLKLSDQPGLLEEKLRKTIGITSAEINVYSKRINVEFDPSAISLEKIKSMIRRR